MRIDLCPYAERETQLLAPYALKSGQSHGRGVPEPDQSYRSPFQRDRDRIVHSSAYRRLSDKTQVFTGLGDYHRTRLTHTIEVVSIARTIGRALRLNEDLIEALAHLHDIGHPPYGHAGEDAIAECMRDVGGFSHNQFGLILVQNLETRCPEYEGLNLTYEVLEGQITRVEKRQMTFLQPLLEAQTVEAADSMTYDAHDTDDALKLGLVSIEQLAEVPLIRECLARIEARWGKLDPRHLRKALAHQLVDIQVRDLLDCSLANLNQHQPASPEQAEACPALILPSETLSEKKRELERFLFAQVYRHPEIIRFRERVQGQLKRMFEGYLGRPELIREKLRSRIDSWGLPRVVGYYLATMTDTFCSEEYERHFAPARPTEP